jgi:heterodisulfide reductase subunit C
MNEFLTEVLATRGGERVLECYQCGTCSGSCPVLSHMEHGPRQIMHMIRSGLAEEVLSSPDIWLCVSCYSCACRCPRGIEITEVMATLRSLAMQRGYNQDTEAKFGLAFTETVAGHGRMFEPEVMARYYARTLDLPGLFRLAPLGLKMLYKGKLPFLPERLDDTRTWRRIFTPAQEGQPEAGGEEETSSHE